MPPTKSADPADFGAAFTALLAAAGLTVDRLRRGGVGRSTLYDWKKGQHLPEDTGPLLEAVRVCLEAARKRGAPLGAAPGDVDGWLRLLAEAKQARDSRIAHSRQTKGGDLASSRYGRPIGRWDPVDLGVHQAIGGGSLPTYVRRHHDDLLHAALDPTPVGNRLVVLRGGSSTGKSRAAYQAVMERLPQWRVDYPRTPAALAQRLQDGIPRHTVVWLDELRYYADADGGPAVLARLADLLAENGRVVVITILWPDYWAYYTADHHDGPGSPDPVAATRVLLKPLPDLTKLGSAAADPSQGGVIDVPDRFTKGDLARAHQCDDPVLEEAIHAARAAGARTGRSPSTWPVSPICSTITADPAPTPTGGR